MFTKKRLDKIILKIKTCFVIFLETHIIYGCYKELRKYFFFANIQNINPLDSCCHS
jgi:hypothetical protein